MSALPIDPIEIRELAAIRPRGSLLRGVLRNPVGATAAAYLTIVFLVVIFGPLVAPFDPDQVSPLETLGPITGTHPLGTDSAGRDVLSRLLVGTRYSIAGALLALVVAAVIGVTGGLIAGYYGKWFDSASSWVTGLLQALPAMVILLAARAVLGPSIWTGMAIFGVLLAPAFFRLIYATVGSVKEELYIDAARVSGLSDTRIIGRHILSVIRSPILVQAAIVAGIAISIQSGLEFLGLGDMSLPTWGSMLNDGFANIYVAPALMVWPSIAIALTCVAFVLLANAIRDSLEGGGGRRGTRQHGPAIEIAPAERATWADAARSTEPQLLSVRGLAVGYEQPDGNTKIVVHDVDLDVARGEVHGLVGESGSGKTQTAWSILGLLPEGGHVVRGSIQFDGHDLVDMTDAQLAGLRGRRIAYIPQEPMSNLDPSFTVGQQLVDPIRHVLGLSRAAARARALDLLKRVGIPDPARTFRAYPHEISGGMAQRVLIAGAVSCDPDIIIADEPTTALDVTVQAEVLDLLRDLRDDFGLAIVLVTHNLGVVADLCDTVSVMHDGKVIESGPVRQVLRHPVYPYTKSLLDAMLEEV